jgi:hypothetical protein
MQGKYERLLDAERLKVGALRADLERLQTQYQSDIEVS